MVLNNPYTVQSLSNRYQIDYSPPKISSTTETPVVYHGGFLSTLITHLHTQSWTTKNNNSNNDPSLSTHAHTLNPSSPLTRTVSNGSSTVKSGSSIASSSSIDSVSNGGGLNDYSSSDPLSPLLSNATTTITVYSTNGIPNHRSPGNNNSNRPNIKSSSVITSSSSSYSNNNNNSNLSGYSSDSFEDVDEEHLELSNVSNSSTNNLINNGGLLSSPFASNHHNSSSSSSKSIPLSPTNSILGPGGRVSPSRDTLGDRVPLPTASSTNSLLSVDNLLTNSVILSPIPNNNHVTNPTTVSPSNAHVAEMQARYSVFTTVPGLHSSPTSPHSHHSNSTNNNVNENSPVVHNNTGSNGSNSVISSTTFNGTKSISKSLGLSNDIGKLVLELEKQENNNNNNSATIPSNFSTTAVHILSSPTIDHSPLPSTGSTSGLEESMPSLASTLHTPPPNFTSNTNNNGGSLSSSSQFFHPSALAEHGYLPSNSENNQTGNGSSSNNNNSSNKTTVKRATITPFVGSTTRKNNTVNIVSNGSITNNNPDEVYEDTNLEDDEFTAQQLLDSEERTDNDRMPTSLNPMTTNTMTMNDALGKTMKGQNKYQLSSLNETDDTNDEEVSPSKGPNNTSDTDNDNYEEEEEVFTTTAHAEQEKYLPTEENNDEVDEDDEEEENTVKDGIDFNSTLRIPLSQLPSTVQRKSSNNIIVPASPPNVPSPSSTLRKPFLQSQNSPGNQSNASEGDYYGSEFDNDTSTDVSKHNLSSPGYNASPVKANALRGAISTSTVSPLPAENKKSFLSDLPPVGINVSNNHSPRPTVSVVSKSLSAPLVPMASSPAEEIEEEELPNYDDEFDASNGNGNLLLPTTPSNTSGYHNRSGNLGDSEQELSYRNINGTNTSIRKDIHDQDGEDNNHHEDDEEDDEVDLSRSPF